MTSNPRDIDVIALDEAIDAMLAGTSPIQTMHLEQGMHDVVASLAGDARQAILPDDAAQAMRRELLTRSASVGTRSRRWTLRTPRVLLIAAISMSVLSVSAWAASHTDTPVGRALRSAGEAIGIVESKPSQPSDTADRGTTTPPAPITEATPSEHTPDARRVHDAGDDHGRDDRNSELGDDRQRDSEARDDRGDQSGNSSGSGSSGSDDRTDDTSHGGSSESGSSTHSGGSSGSSHDEPRDDNSGSGSSGSGGSGGGGSDTPDEPDAEDD